MERFSQVVLRNQARLQPGPLLLVNPPRDTLFRQIQNAERPLRISTQDHGDQQWLSGSGASVSFDTVPMPDPDTRTVVLNLPREKERLTLMLHAISATMAPGARLWLVGENKAGAKSAGRYLESFFGRIDKLDSARHCVLYEATEPKTGHPFELNAYETVWPVEFDGHRVEVVSLPGVFSHGRLDQGTRLLLQTLATLRPSGRILDFACGSGVVGCALMAAGATDNLTLLDVSALALAASQRTLERNVLTAALLASDGLTGLEGRYDWIISNPPFHRGVASDLDIAAQLFAAAGTFLLKNGRIVIVCNRHLPYASWLQNHFERVERLDANEEFIIIQAGKPRR